MAAIRQLYSNAVSVGRERCGTARRPKACPTCPAALQAVEGLAEAVTQNRTALVALTAMRNYDNYTFTHMVNVSILTMGAGAGARHRGHSCCASSACRR